MVEIAKKTNHSAVSLHFCCNDILYLNVHVLRINGTNQISIWWDMTDLHWKVGFTPRKTEHAPHYGQASYSGAYKNPEHGRPLGAKLRACQSWGPCSIHILKTPFFWLSQPPLILYSINILYNNIGSSLKDRCWGGNCQKKAKKGKFRNSIVRPDLFNSALSKLYNNKFRQRFSTGQIRFNVPYNLDCLLE